jgi:hypothetical protein
MEYSLMMTNNNPLPWDKRIKAIESVLIDDHLCLIHKPNRHVLPLKDDGVLLVMAISGPHISAVKSISVIPSNILQNIATIQA